MKSLAIIASALALTFAASSDAQADVTFGGTWPDAHPKVSISVTDVTRTEALRALAAQAGWNLVLREMPGDRVTLELKDASAGEVLQALLADGKWVADRQGSIVTIRAAGSTSSDSASSEAAVAAPSSPPSPPDPPPPPEPPLAKASGKERDVRIFANSVRIGKDDVVRNVTIMGGNIDIEGRVTGDLNVYGGNAHLHGTGQIEGDARVTGGSVEIDKDGTIVGDLEVLGGEITGTEHAKIGGDVKIDPEEAAAANASFISRAGHEISEALRFAAFLFILGVMFIALGGERAEKVRVAIADKPMKSVALGIVGIAGTLGALVLCAITIIGIPVAFVGFLAAIALGFAGVTSALSVLGATVAGHKSANVYVHLAVGCAVFAVVGFIPWLGGFAQFLIVLAGLGGIVTTRALGFWKRKKTLEPHPYR
jgi:hypothetical protein